MDCECVYKKEKNKIVVFVFIWKKKSGGYSLNILILNSLKVLMNGFCYCFFFSFGMFCL